LSLWLFKDEEIGGGKTEHIHESVPTKLDRPELDDVWIYVGEWQQVSISRASPQLASGTEVKLGYFRDRVFDEFGILTVEGGITNRKIFLLFQFQIL